MTYLTSRAECSRGFITAKQRKRKGKGIHPMSNTAVQAYLRKINGQEPLD